MQGDYHEHWPMPGGHAGLEGPKEWLASLGHGWDSWGEEGWDDNSWGGGEGYYGYGGFSNALSVLTPSSNNNKGKNNNDKSTVSTPAFTTTTPTISLRDIIAVTATPTHPTYEDIRTAVTTRPISTTAKTTTARRLANNGTSTFNKFAALSEPEPLSMSISNYIPTTTAAPTHTTADQQPAQKRAEEFAKQTLYIPPWARDVAGSGIGEGKTGVGAGIGGCAGIEGCDCIGGGQTISVQHECVSERIIEQNQNIPCGSESEMSYGVTPSDQVYNDNGSVGLWSDVGKNAWIAWLR